MRSKTVSKSANGMKSRASAGKRQNTGTTERRQGSSVRSQTSTNGRGQQSSNRRSQEVTGRTGQSSGQESSGSRRQKAASGTAGGSSGKKDSPQGESPLEKFFLAQLKDIYYAEQKITQSLPKMQEAATTEELKEAFEDHLHQTQRHVRRLEKVFQTLNKKAEGEKCEAIEGISREVESIIKETEDGTLTRDAALIMAAQKVEHYEIATYGGLLQLAITMGLYDAAELLDRTLLEEEDTDLLLTSIAENEINLGAECEGHQYSWSQEQQGEQEEDEEKDEEKDTEKKEKTDFAGVH